MNLLRRKSEAAHLLRPRFRKQSPGIPIAQLSKGEKIVTGGGSVGVITGKQTKNAVQIKLTEGGFVGEYDWISKLAHVEKV
jgi:preprotein translocase subunit YajC